MKIVSLILAKSSSKRLPGKNTLPFNGKPMFLINVEKCLKIFNEVYVSSDSLEILEVALKAGAIPIKRSKELCGDTPNIPVYRHAMKVMDCDAFVAVQANSPTVNPDIIEKAKKILESGFQEVMTTDDNNLIYGSVWGMTKERLQNYGDPYVPTPDALIPDPSVDIHTQQDYELALKQ